MACGALAQRIRDVADFGPFLARLVATYEATVGENADRALDLAVEQPAASDYIHKLVPLLKTTNVAQKT
jgi:hypothetical protein